MRMRLDRWTFCRLAVCWLALPTRPRAFANDESNDTLTVSIHREAVESSSIASIGFHNGLQVLEIELRTGALYRYFAVPAAVFDEFQKSESKGRYFSHHIRGRYRFQRLNPTKP